MRVAPTPSPPYLPKPPVMAVMVAALVVVAVLLAAVIAAAWPRLLLAHPAPAAGFPRWGGRPRPLLLPLWRRL